MAMTERRRGESKLLKKDQQVKRELRDEIGAETLQTSQATQYRNHNRDTARGDWDRSGRRGDEYNSREEPKQGDSTENE